MVKNKLWFRAKRYGWGWQPASWQGWAIMFIFIDAVILNFRRIDAIQHSGSDTLINFVPQTLLMVLALIVICYKTGEKPRWRWGGK